VAMQVDLLAHFSSDKWRQLIEARGDFAALQIALETDKPVAEFKTAWPRF
jgi:hypothetical protein